LEIEEKAFDTVNHDIMLNKLYHDGITGDMWLLLRNISDGLILKVKWGDQTTESIDIKQGIRQGAKLSTLLYKRYNNTILDSITKVMVDGIKCFFCVYSQKF
jgi:hypothetical protein